MLHVPSLKSASMPSFAQKQLSFKCEENNEMPQDEFCLCPETAKTIEIYTPDNEISLNSEQNWKKDINLHKQLWIMSHNAYYPNEKIELTPEWERLNEWQDSSIQAAVYHNMETDDIVISYRGSDSISDLRDASKLLINFSPKQKTPAGSFYEKIRNEYGAEKKIILTGHSLGGTLAQYIASQDENKENTIAVTFNPVGIADVMKYKNPTMYRANYQNILNYQKKDPVTALFAPQIGETLRQNKTGHKLGKEVWDLETFKHLDPVKAAELSARERLRALVDDARFIIRAFFGGN